MMRRLYKWPLRFRSLCRRSHVETELADEIQFHLEKQIEQYVAQGMPPENARYAALRDLGGLEQHKEECRDVRRVNIIEDLMRDLRFGGRMLRRNPGFTAVAVLALALGIGANTAIFSVVNAVMLARMPYENPDRLVMVWERSPRTGKANVANPVNFLEWQARNHSFERIAALVETGASLTGEGEPEQVRRLIVSDGFFQILGVKAIVGRWFTHQEDTPGSDYVVILGEGLWRRRYAADPELLGRQILINNHKTTIVGIMPADFRFPFTKADLWQPMALDRANAMKTGRYLVTVARLRDGVTVAGAQADMDALMPQLQRERPEFNSKWGITVVSLRDQVIGDVRTPLLVLLGAVGLVLLIACANVANLMLMRAAGRGREIAVRAALGARALRIARQLLVESTLTATAGGTLGLLIGIWSMSMLVAALPDTIAYANLKTIRIDTTVFLFTAAVSLTTGILFGLGPAFKAARTEVPEALRDAGRSIVGGRSVGRSALVIAEVALTMILLVGAGLLIRSFARLASVEPGFDASHVLSMELSEAGRFGTDREFLEFNSRMLERVRAVPGVEAAGTSHYLPLGRIIPATMFWRADHPRPNAGEEPITEVLCVMPGYFAAMKIPLRSGRVFADRDCQGAPLAVIVNQTLAKQFFANEDPIGKRLHIGWGRPNETYEIVGVVGDVHQKALDKDPRPGVFLSTLQEPTSPVNLVVRSRGDPKKLAGMIQAEIRALDRNIPISDVRTMEDCVSESISAPRFNTILLGGFGVLALVLAAVGVFGVVSYSASRRTQEMGIRRALGADSANVMCLVLAHGMRLTVVGVAIGLGCAYGLAHWIESLLFGVTPTDPMTFAGVGALLIVVALVASYLPARRAASVDPQVALRYE
jgi:putative ABC transport system permease protein